jgi:L-fuculose-phosphate aldolase
MDARVRFDVDGRCVHVGPDGEPLYPARYRALSAFSEGLAVAHRVDGGVVLIDPMGRELDLGGERFAWALPPVEGRVQVQTHDGRNGWVDLQGRFHASPDDPEWDARCELVRVARLIYERGYNVSIDGNLSVRLPNQELLMTPSGCHLGFLRPGDLIITNLTGRLIRGDRQPTSEYRLHTALYARLADIHCVVHVHSPFAVAASLAGVDLAQSYITVAPVPTTAYARIASEQSPRVLEPFMEQYNWAILPRHGTVAWAGSVWDAFLRIEGLEHAAKIVMAAQATGHIEPLSQEHRLELLTLWGLEHLEVPDAS